MLFAEPRLASSTSALVALGLGLLISSTLAVTVFGAYRSAPPDVLLLALVWFLVLSPGSKAARVVGVILVIIVGYLAYESGFRTHLALWLLAAPLTLLATKSLRGTGVATILVAALTLASLALGDTFTLLDNLSSTRFDTLITNSADPSLDARFAEARDVVATADSQWLFGQVLLGSGPGATYFPTESFMEPNINEYGTAHSIHIGPVMIYYRYGLLGLVMLIGLIAIVARTLWSARHVSATERRAAQVFGVAAALYLVDFLMFNSTNQPTMALSIAVVLWLWLQSRQRTA